MLFIPNDYYSIQLILPNGILSLKLSSSSNAYNIYSYLFDLPARNYPFSDKLFACQAYKIYILLASFLILLTKLSD